MLERRLEVDQELLSVVDGEKGQRKAIDEMFGSRVSVQRCMWPKRENVVGYLPKSIQTSMRRKFQEAHE